MARAGGGVTYKGLDMGRTRKTLHAPTTKSAIDYGGVDYFWKDCEQSRYRHRRNEKESNIYCPFCGFCTRDLCLHISYAHKITAEIFKISFGMSRSAQCTCDVTHIRRIRENKRRIAAGIIGPRKKTKKSHYFDSGVSKK